MLSVLNLREHFVFFCLHQLSYPCCHFVCVAVVLQKSVRGLRHPSWRCGWRLGSVVSLGRVQQDVWRRSFLFYQTLWQPQVADSNQKPRKTKIEHIYLFIHSSWIVFIRSFIFILVTVLIPYWLWLYLQYILLYILAIAKMYIFSTVYKVNTHPLWARPHADV